MGLYSSFVTSFASAITFMHCPLASFKDVESANMCWWFPRSPVNALYILMKYVKLFCLKQSRGVSYR